ncbi:hypothetical protein MMC25_003666 [Agyrium rufum]|nr:hypothetical protein [Agyrium rufum]
METYNGQVRTPGDAIILFEACRLGLLPRVQRRLSEKERQSIKSGSVFVWDEREAGMRRWTDGKSWSASRVSGSFLTYREMEGKRGGGGFAQQLTPQRAGKTPESTRGSDSDLEQQGGGDEGPDGYRYKPDGLMKQSFSITTSSGNHLHLISYYTRAHTGPQNLKQPTNDPSLRHIHPPKGMYPESTVHEHHNIPAVTRSPLVNGPHSQIPQMAGYARVVPQQPPSNYPPPGYWTSHPPPMHPSGYGYYAPPGHHPPPHQHPHQIPYQQTHHQPPPPPHNYPGPQQINAMSHVYPPSASYPQSPVPSNLSRNSTPPNDHNASRPSYNAHHRNPSSGSLMQQIPPAAPRAPSTNLMSPPQTQTSRTPQPQSPASTPPLSKIDPRLMIPSPLSQQQSIQHASYEPASASASSMTKRETINIPKPLESPTSSQASVMPSISALMNEPPPTQSQPPAPPPSLTQLAQPPVQQNATATASPTANESRGERVQRSCSRSPGGTKTSDEIPGEKIGFREDMRALRVLDRAFKT